MLLSRLTISVGAYGLDVLLRDLVGHDQQPSAFIVYLFLSARAERTRWQPVSASLRDLADATGLSKSAIQSALKNLRRRELILTRHAHPTANPEHTVLRP